MDFLWAKWANPALLEMTSVGIPRDAALETEALLVEYGL